MIFVLPRGAYHNILQQRFLLGDVVVGESDGDRAGFSVSLSNDGTTLAVGAFTSSNGDLSSSGSVTVHKVEGGSVGNSFSSCLVNQGQT